MQHHPSEPPHHPSFTENSSTTKEQKLTKQCCLPVTHRFSKQSSQYQYWKAHKYSILTLIELGPSVSESSTRSQQFVPAMILNTEFIKQESNIFYPQDSISNQLLQHYVPPLMGRALRSYIPIKSWNNPGDISLSGNCTNAIRSHTHHKNQRPLT